MLETIRAAMAREPLRVRLVAVVAVIVASHFGLHGDWVEPVVDLVAVSVASETARRKVSPAKPNPPAAGPLPNKEHTTMNLQDAWASVQAKAASMTSAVESFLAAHPEIEAEAATTLKSASDDLAQSAQAAVDASTPADAHQVLDDAISAVDAKLESDIAALQADAQTKKDALQTAKGLLAVPVAQ